MANAGQCQLLYTYSVEWQCSTSSLDKNSSHGLSNRSTSCQALFSLLLILVTCGETETWLHPAQVWISRLRPISGRILGQKISQRLQHCLHSAQILSYQLPQNLQLSIQIPVNITTRTLDEKLQITQGFIGVFLTFLFRFHEL